MAFRDNHRECLLARTDMARPVAPVTRPKTEVIRGRLLVDCVPGEVNCPHRRRPDSGYSLLFHTSACAQSL